MELIKRNMEELGVLRNYWTLLNVFKHTFNKRIEKPKRPTRKVKQSGMVHNHNPSTW